MIRVLGTVSLLVTIVFAATPVAAQNCTVSAAGNINYVRGRGRAIVACAPEELRMNGWDGVGAWGALHDRGGDGVSSSAAGGVDPRVGSDRHDDPRGCSGACRSMNDIFPVERRERHMVRPRSAFLGLRALGVRR